MEYRKILEMLGMWLVGGIIGWGIVEIIGGGNSSFLIARSITYGGALIGPLIKKFVRGNPKEDKGWVFGGGLGWIIGVILAGIFLMDVGALSFPVRLFFLGGVGFLAGGLVGENARGSGRGRIYGFWGGGVFGFSIWFALLSYLPSNKLGNYSIFLFLTLYFGVFGGANVGVLVGKKIDEKFGKGNGKGGKKLRGGVVSFFSRLKVGFKKLLSKLGSLGGRVGEISYDEDNSESKVVDFETEIENLLEKEPDLDVRKVEKLVEEDKTEKAREALDELKGKYSEYEDTIERLEDLDQQKKFFSVEISERRNRQRNIQRCKRRHRRQKSGFRRKVGAAS